MDRLTDTNQRRQRIWKDSRAQDLIEYALLAGFVAVGTGAMMASVADNITPVLSQVVSVIGAAVDSGQPRPVPGSQPPGSRPPG